jgi:hypothetical protein
LRRLFDAEFAASLASAANQLGDATALAPRVVEAAFVNAWMQRSILRDATQVTTFVTDEIQHGAARALSRRAAASRFGGKAAHDDKARASSTGEADPARSWAEIEKTIHGGGASGAAHAAVADTTRHEAAAHLKSVGRGRSWVVPALGGIVVLAGLVAVGLYFDRAGEDDAILTTVSSSGMQPMIQSSPGQIGSTALGDSTKVKIGPETKLFVPDGFPSKIHALRIEGTAKFDVAPVGEKGLPFHVIARKTHFIATGTSFVISAFPDDSSAMIEVLQGSVTVKSPKGMQVVGANQALVSDSTGLHAPSDAERAVAFGWVDGNIASNRQLRDAVATLARWFNLIVKVPDLPLLDRSAAFSVPLDSSRAAIDQIEKSANVKFTYEGDNKAFRDAGSAKGAASAKSAPSTPAARKKK